jgi:hypothetical protein
MASLPAGTLQLRAARAIEEAPLSPPEEKTRRTRGFALGFCCFLLTALGLGLGLGLSRGSSVQTVVTQKYFLQVGVSLATAPASCE